MAKLYLRGSLCNQTLKGLSSTELGEIEKIVDMVMIDPNLQQCRVEFCNVLARTIRNDYTNREAGEQEYMLAIMKAAVAAKHGYAGNPPSDTAITDPIQRKKWFQTFAFNYLRQILRENKLPTQSTKHKVTVPADQAVLHLVGEAIRETINQQHDHRHKRTLKSLYSSVEVIETADGYLLRFDHWSFPIGLVHMIRELSAQYLKHNVAIRQVVDGIQIKRTSEKIPLITLIKKYESLIRVVSFDSESQDKEVNYRDQLEQSVIAAKRRPEGGESMEASDTITTLRDRLPDDAKPVFDIYNEDTRPIEYIEQFGDGRPRICHIAQFLNLSPREVKRLLSIIRHHCLYLGVGT
jgi:hypothetical protein